MMADPCTEGWAACTPVYLYPVSFRGLCSIFGSEPHITANLNLCGVQVTVESTRARANPGTTVGNAVTRTVTRDAALPHQAHQHVQRLVRPFEQIVAISFLRPHTRDYSGCRLHQSDRAGCHHRTPCSSILIY